MGRWGGLTKKGMTGANRASVTEEREEHSDIRQQDERDFPQRVWKMKFSDRDKDLSY